jgi:CheY-like chemotaxis protein
MDVLESGTGDEALRCMDQPVDLLITDVMLPGALKGPDVARHLLERAPSTPVLFVSGYDRGLLAGHQLSDHRTSFLAKPFKRSELEEKIDALLA